MSLALKVDIEGLKRQVEERKLRENTEKRREEAFGKPVWSTVLNLSWILG